MSDLSHLLQRLSRFYLGCIQEENLRHLQFTSDQRGTYYVSPSIRREQFLHDDHDRLAASSLTQSERTFVRTFVQGDDSGTEEDDRLFYGYPVFVDNSHRVLPLLFVELRAECSEDADDPIQVTRRDEHMVYVNHKMLDHCGFAPEAVVDIQNRVQSEDDSFGEKLAYLLHTMDAAKTSDEAKTSRSWRNSHPLPRPLQTGLHPSVALFQSGYNSYTHQLKRDLHDLHRWDFLREEAAGTALHPLLDPGGREVGSSDHSPAEVARLNESQKQAVRSALGSNFTVIKGPPGTGKSQVVVNLLAEAVFRQKPVLFASKNNKAVDVVRDRLQNILGEEFDFVLRLGSRADIEEAQHTLGARLEGLKSRRDALLDKYTPGYIDELRQKACARQSQIAECREHKKRYEEAQRERKNVGDRLPAEWTDADPPTNPECIPLSSLRPILDRACALAGNDWPGLVLWIRRLFLGRRLFQRLQDAIDSLTSDLPHAVQTDVYTRVYAADRFSDLVDTLTLLKRYRTWIARRQTELRAREKLEAVLSGAPTTDDRIEQLQKERTECFKNLLQSVWIRRLARDLPKVRRAFRRYFDAINDNSSSYRDKLDEQKSAIQSLGAYLPVWIVTNLSVRNAVPLRAEVFDLVIMDEASQCDIASALPLLYRAKRSAIIGDPNQLQHITSIDEPQELRLIRRSDVADAMPMWSYRKHSLYACARRGLDDQRREPELLRRHYRCHPDIISFSNSEFYDGQLICEKSASDFDVPEKWRGVRWFDVPGKVPSTTSSAYNEKEIEAVVRLLDRWVEENLVWHPSHSDEPSVGVVTPFRAQMKRIQERVQKRRWWDRLKNRFAESSPVIVGTAHRFQGDEKQLMIFSPVVAEGIRGYTADWVARKVPQLLNVAVTRAQASLQVVGDLNHCRRVGSHLGSLAAHVSTVDCRDGAIL